jgi:hypothetical protein
MWFLLLAIVVGSIFHLLPLLNSHAEQDECTFGPVSNERYRQLLQQAREQRSGQWRPLPWHNNDAEKVLQSIFDDLNTPSSSVHERIAILHAVMRAFGAVYRRTGWGGEEPYEAALNGAGLLPFNYHLDVNRLGYFRPVWRDAWLIPQLTVKDALGPFMRPIEAGHVIFTVWFPELTEAYVQIPRSKFGEECPLIPPHTWQHVWTR